VGKKRKRKISNCGGLNYISKQPEKCPFCGEDLPPSLGKIWVKCRFCKGLVHRKINKTGRCKKIVPHRNDPRKEVNSSFFH